MSGVLKVTQLEGLKRHVYSCSNDSILDKYFQIWWNFVVEWVPLWLAPNAITIIGLLVNIFTTILLLIYSPNASSNPPSWTLFLWALGLFVYQTLDAIDGKQARRTKSSSPLGELFDHGCDSVSTILVSISMSICFRLGDIDGRLILFNVLLASSIFYLAHWRAYVTATLAFGKFDVTEIQVLSISIMILSGFAGTTFWNIVVYESITTRAVCLTCCIVFGVWTLLSQFVYIIKESLKIPNSCTKIVPPLVPFLFMGLGVFGQVYISNVMLNSSPLMLSTLFCLLLTKQTNKLIVAHMTYSEFEYIDYTYLINLSLFFLPFLGYDDLLILYALLIFVSVDALVYYSRVCLLISKYLGIKIFKISYEPKAE